MIVTEPDATQRLTPQQVERAVGVAFARAEQLREIALALHDQVQAGSPLAGDDRASNPYKVSHAVIRVLDSATEHLDALRVLLVKGQVLHPAAPFTLARAAIEAGSTAVWLLLPASRQERVMRSLRLYLADARDSNTIAEQTGLSVRRPLDERRSHLEAIAARAAGGGPVQLTPVRSTALVKAADEAGTSRVGVLAAWRVCSGFAHVRLWPTLAVLDREELPSNAPGDVTLKVTSSLDRVLWAVWAGLDVTEHGVNLFRLRAVPPY